MFPPRINNMRDEYNFRLLKTHESFMPSKYTAVCDFVFVLKRSITNKLKDYKQDGFNKQRLS